MPKKSTISQAKYDQAHCRTYGLKLNTGTDADIIAKLASVPSMQGYIKKLIREDIARTRIKPTLITAIDVAMKQSAPEIEREENHK